jgi:hypothetical protein
VLGGNCGTFDTCIVRVVAGNDRAKVELHALIPRSTSPRHSPKLSSNHGWRHNPSLILLQPSILPRAQQLAQLAPVRQRADRAARWAASPSHHADRFLNILRFPWTTASAPSRRPAAGARPASSAPGRKPRSSSSSSSWAARSAAPARAPSSGSPPGCGSRPLASRPGRAASARARPHHLRISARSHLRTSPSARTRPRPRCGCAPPLGLSEQRSAPTPHPPPRPKR